MENDIKISDTGFAPILLISTPVESLFNSTTSLPGSIFDLLKDSDITIEEDSDNLFSLEELILEEIPGEQTE